MNQVWVTNEKHQVSIKYQLPTKSYQSITKKFTIQKLSVTNR